MLLGLVLLVALVTETSAASTSCQLRKHNDGKIIGKAKFTSMPGKYQRVELFLQDDDLPNGLHGFHIHQKEVTGNDCVTTGGHYNPDGVDHGAPGGPASSSHVGDFGNVISFYGGIYHTMQFNVGDGTDGGNAYYVSEDKFDLSGDKSIIGRAVVLHAGTDDLGKGGDDGSRKTGNAGSRWACCTLEENKRKYRKKNKKGE